MPRHQRHHPVDERTQPRARLALRRIGDEQRHRRHLPVIEQRQQRAARQRLVGHVPRQPQHSESGNAGGEVGIAVVLDAGVAGVKLRQRRHQHQRGQRARPDGSPEPDLPAQVRLAFEHLNAVLAAAGCRFDDVIDATIFIVDPERHFETVWPVVMEHWGGPPHPTLTGVGVTWLYGFQFEIKVIARLPTLPPT